MRGPIAGTVAILVGLTTMAGCSTTKDGPYSSDPLLMSRGNASASSRTRVELPLDEPLAPRSPNLPHLPMMRPQFAQTPGAVKTTPSVMLASTPKITETPEPPAMPVMAIAKEPIENIAIPAAVNVVPTPVVDTAKPATGKPPVAVVGTHGHGANYVWLQGVVDRHYRGYLNLRYTDPSQEDYWGGKVKLIEDARLNGLQDGDVIFVEGEVLRNDDNASSERRDGYPSYRITNVWIVSRKS